jgi:hypothetical protein
MVMVMANGYIGNGNGNGNEGLAVSVISIMVIERRKLISGMKMRKTIFAL